MPRYLIDTNILIDHLRGEPNAAQFLRDVEAGRVRATISVITEAQVNASASPDPAKTPAASSKPPAR